MAAGGGVNMGALTSSEASSVEARYSPVTSMRTRDALRRGELTPRREAGACHAETYRDAADSSILQSTNSLRRMQRSGFAVVARAKPVRGPPRAPRAV